MHSDTLRGRERERERQREKEREKERGGGRGRECEGAHTPLPYGQGYGTVQYGSWILILDSWLYSVSHSPWGVLTLS